ncbi:Protein R13A5.15, partial [Aphelenchoides avenae]
DLLAFSLDYFSGRLPSMGLASEFFLSLPTPLVTFLFFQHFYFIEMQYFVSFFICLNRFTAVILSSKHEKIWQRFTTGTLAAAVMLPLAPTAHNLAYECFFFHLSANDTKLGINYKKTGNT